jgi:hypothetical protein
MLLVTADGPWQARQAEDGLFDWPGPTSVARADATRELSVR